jgi:integrase
VELVQFFGHDLFRRILKLPGAAGGPAAWWLPALAYCTGTREEELVQLKVRDVRKAKGLGWYLDVTDLGDGQTLKTLTSKRRVPIHSELVRIGFLHYVDALREAGQVQLFPLLRSTYTMRSCIISSRFR